MGGSPAKVCIAIATYRRPAMLAALLQKLPTLVLRENAPNVEVLIVDNDPDGGARPTVGQFFGTLQWPLHYRHVPEPGLSVVRNFAIDFAAGGFEFLAMIDDDEEPEPQWLDELLRVERSSGADAVIGPVPRALPPQSPAWVRKGDFFPAAAYDVPDGHLVPDGHTGNCLLKVSTLLRQELAFDSAMNLTGGEDVLFFRTLVARGGRIAFAANAVATETVPLQRTTARYLWQVEFRSGNTLSFCDRALSGTPRSLATRAAKGAGLVAFGVGLLVPRMLLRGWGGVVRSGCNLSRGIGMLSGLFGYRIAMYRRVARRSGRTPGESSPKRPGSDTGHTQRATSKQAWEEQPVSEDRAKAETTSQSHS